MPGAEDGDDGAADSLDLIGAHRAGLDVEGMGSFLVVKHGDGAVVVSYWRRMVLRPDTMNADRRRAASMNNPYVVSPRDAARALRAEVWNVSGMMQLPVDPFAMADRLGIAVKQERLDPNLAGFIVREGGGPVEVFLNASDGGMRQRFTLAHELGHFVKNRNEQNIGYVDERSELAASGANPAEVWCNQFAAELLMPAAIIKKYWAEGWSADELAQKFNVSGSAIDFRLKNLGLR